MRRELGTFGYEPKVTIGAATKGWHRIECPFCGYHRAQIHFDLGLFWCPKRSCARKLTTAEHWSVVDQYWDVTNKVLRSEPVRKYGDWLTLEHRETRTVAEGREFCQTRLMEYAANGELDDWEIACDGDADRLRGFVYTALHRDLLNYADKKVHRIRRQRAEGSQTDEPTPAGELIDGLAQDAEVAEFRRTGTPPDGQLAHLWAEPETTGDDYPTLTLRQGDDGEPGLSEDDIAVKLGVSVSTVKRRIKKETARLLEAAKSKRLLK